VPGSDDVAHGIDVHLHVEFAHPRHHEIATISVGIRERQTIAATTWKASNLAE
jgi:hypothetical protein